MNETIETNEIEAVSVDYLLGIIDELSKNISDLELQLRVKNLEIKTAEMLIKYYESFCKKEEK